MSLCLKTNNFNLLLERNKYRDLNKQLSESIIENIFKKFDYPDELEWEKSFTIVLMNDNINLNDSSWILKYKPIKIINFIPNCHEYEEDKYTKNYIEKYGIENVGSCSNVEINLDKTILTQIQQMYCE